MKKNRKGIAFVSGFFLYYLAGSETGYLPAPVSENVDRGGQFEFDVYLIQPSFVEAAKRTMPLK
ncbi:hypothetical protein [Peribacillus simplex]|uniref:hypothetical protein n=1 Tax=Peribacillus simplex TaxID=1478 RepID=UPI0024C1917F|nr:hypothetical protein [Peribacillus simplex]WHY54339.1 hypothetical protein QNH43_14150 [Peribacillus simplex]